MVRSLRTLKVRPYSPHRSCIKKSVPLEVAGESEEKIRQQVKQFQAAKDQNNISLTLHPGMEIAMPQQLMQECERTELLSLGKSNYYLLEPPFQEFTENLLEIVFSFKRSGKDVILTHSERIPFFQKNTAHLVHLIEQGILIQANIGSLLGEFGKASKKTAVFLAERGGIHFAAPEDTGPMRPE